MKQKMSRWELLLMVGFMVILVVGLWCTSGSGLDFASAVLAGNAPQVTSSGGDEPGTIVTHGTGTGKVMPAVSGTGAAGQVTFWTGTDTLSGDNGFYWDNTNKRLGIGTASPLRKLHYYGDAALFQRDVDAAGFIIQRTDTNRWVFGASENPSLGTGFAIYTYPVGAPSATPRLFIDLNGRVGIGTTSPTKKLQVETDSGEAVYGKNTTSNNSGYLGDSNYGVYGEHSTGNHGYLGSNLCGVVGSSAHSSGYGVYGGHGISNNEGYLGSSNFGAYGKHYSSGNYGYLGDSNYGVHGASTSGTAIHAYQSDEDMEASLCSSDHAVWGKNYDNNAEGYIGGDYGVYAVYDGGNYGFLAGGNEAVYGHHTSGNYGKIGGSAYAVYGNHNSGNFGWIGSDSYGVCGHNDSGNSGYLGGSSYGVYGEHGSNSPYGYLGGSTYGAYGREDISGNYGALGNAQCGVYGYSASGKAGSFVGDVNVTGTLTVGSSPGVSMGRIYRTSDGEIISTDGGQRCLLWVDAAGTGQINIVNNSYDNCDYWWQAQKGGTTSGGSGAVAMLTSVAIITNTNTNDYGFEVHFGQADGTDGWCSVWLQYANTRLVGHYIKY